MPELPEVENMIRMLKSYENKQITDVYLSGKSLRQPLNCNFIPEVSKKIILKVERLAKYVIFTLSDSTIMVAHAGMSGRFLAKTHFNLNKEPPAKHDHVVLYLTDTKSSLSSGSSSCKSSEISYSITFNDPRRFGMFYSIQASDLAKAPFKQQLGPDALDPTLNAKYLALRFNRSTTSIKSTLLNQKIISGIGNIYASEILFYSKIHPLRPTFSLTLPEIEILLYNTKIVLEKAISLGGSTLKDYKKPDGSLGGFQHKFAVYNKAGKRCIMCSKIVDEDLSRQKCEIKKITQNGRSTFYCENIQKI
ncbi:Bifunctional DNA-formamidopyrimidine glycosylase/DNA-(apurinic or apyrimidinic site) lyase [Candidatus Hepatincolaceae symbiont of Richtersius coronifer]